MEFYVAKKSKYTNLSKMESNGTLWIIAVIVVVAAIIFGGVFYLINKPKPAVVSGFPTGASMDSDGILVARGESVQEKPTEVTIFEDPICPLCGHLEKEMGTDLYKGVNEGKIVLRVHLMNFMDPYSKTGDYSTRAVSAIQCVATGEDKAQTFKYKSWLFENQPPEDRTWDYSNQQLADAAQKQINASSGTVQCILNGGRINEAKAAGSKSSDALKAVGANGTPTVLIDGKMVENWQTVPGQIADLVK